MSYNFCWFPTNSEKRLSKLLDCVRRHNPNVIFIQNVGCQQYEEILREFGLLKYKRSNYPGLKNMKSADFIFSTFDLVDLKFTPFYNTNEDCGVLQANIQLKIDENEDSSLLLQIGTTHIDFGSSYGIQSKQIKMLQSFFLKNEALIIGGCFNTLSYEVLNVPDNWIDSWYEAGNDENKYTYDSSRNIMTPVPYKDRPDRILFKGNDSLKLDCTHHELIGTGYEYQSDPISPHYGIISKFTVN